MNNNNIKCILGCLQDEDQKHTFFNCDKLKKKNNSVRYEHIFGTLDEQKQAIQMMASIERSRIHIKKKHLSPGGVICQDPRTLDIIFNGAADIISS